MIGRAEALMAYGATYSSQIAFTEHNGTDVTVLRRVNPIIDENGYSHRAFEVRFHDGTERYAYASELMRLEGEPRTDGGTVRMTTAEGRLVMPSNLGVPSPYDLATSLGRVPRFVGHTRVWWTVLHHVVLCYLTAERAGLLPDHVEPVHLLLHDSEEAIVGDTPTPWKSGAQRRLGARLHQRITRAYTGGDLPKGPQAANLKRVDMAVLRMECARVGPPHVDRHSGLCLVPDDTANLAVHASLAFQQVHAMAHDPYHPAVTELASWWFGLMETWVPAERWQILRKKHA